MSKPSKSKSSKPSNVVSLEAFRAERAAKQHADQFMHTFTRNTDRLVLPPLSPETKKWLDQYGDL